MPGRTRSRAKTSDGSHTVMPSGTTTLSQNTEYSETTTDVTGNPHGENVFNLKRTTKMVTPFSGNSKTGVPDNIYGTYSNYWPTYIRSTLVTHQSVSGLKSNNDMAVQVLAVSNPSKPVVDLPLFFAEMKDFPGMAESIARVFMRRQHMLTDLSETWLNTNFGFMPLLNDLKAMTQFQEEMDNRIKKLYAMNNGKGLHSKVKGPTEVVHTVLGNQILDTSDGTTRCRVDRLTSVTQWGTTRWRPDPNKPLPSSHSEMVQLARKAALGLTPSASTAWNLIPWSWMADWFSNVGQFLNAHRNTVPAVHSPVCVMRHSKTTWSGKRHLPDNYPELKGGDFTAIREDKVRAVMPFVLPTANLGELISPRQVSILSSLAILRLPQDIQADLRRAARYVIVRR